MLMRMVFSRLAAASFHVHRVRNDFLQGDTSCRIGECFNVDILHRDGLARKNHSHQHKSRSGDGHLTRSFRCCLLCVDHAEKFGNRANKNAAGKVLSIRPAVVAAYAQVPIAWNCGGAEAPAGMKMFGSNQTTLPGHFLPVDCRGEK